MLKLKQFWQWLKGLWRRLWGSQPLPPPTPTPKPRPTLTDTEREAIFMGLLEEVERGASPGTLKGIIFSKGVDGREWMDWLRRFGERLLETPGQHQELARRMVRLGECREDVPVVAAAIGRELLAAVREVEVTDEREDVDVGAEEWFERGKQQYKKGDLRGAITSLDKALAIKPDYHEAWFIRGAMLYILGELSEAIDSFDKALAIKPDFHEAWSNRGIALSDLGELSEAIASFDKALAIKPDKHEAWSNRGDALFNLGELSEAIDSFDKALAIKPDDHQVLLNRGVALFNLGELSGAIDSFDKALAIKSDKHEAWSNRGVALANLGELSEALDSFDKALELKPDFHEVWSNRSRALKELGELSEAIASLDKALAIKPDFHEAWYNRGIVLSDLGELSEAIASFDKALAIKPDKHEAWSDRGLALTELGELSEAIASLDKALAIKPDYAPAWLNRGIAVGQAISYNPIAAEILQAQFPESPLVVPNPQLTRGGYEGALLSYEEGLKHCPADIYPEGYGRMHREIGITHYFQGQKNYRQRRPFYWQAVSSYNRALSTLTKEAYPQLHLETLRDLIKALLGLGQVDQAQQLRRDGTDLLRRLVAEKRSQQEKQQLALKFADFQQLTVYTLVQSGQWREAWEAAEAGKNACLSWLLYALADELPECSYAGVAPLLREDRAIVYWHLSPIALTAFVLKYGEEGPVVVSSGVLTETAADSTDEAPLERRAENERLIQFEEWLEKWNQLYGDYREGKKQERTAATWKDELPEMLEELKIILDIEAIETALGEAKELILIPHRDLHRLPLHSLFGDGFVISYLPSAGLAAGTGETPVLRGNLLTVENPKSISDFGDKELPELYNAKEESKYICRRLLPKSHKLLPADEATQEKIEAELAKAWDIFHFSGHGQYNSKQPRKSALYLTGKERLRVEDIVKLNLEACRLVYLSACETAVTGNETITAEYVGLVSAFLSRGVDTVISTLWTVADGTTALITIQFYRLLLLEKIPPVEALNMATRWLRDLTYEDLFQWYQTVVNELPRDDDLRSHLRSGLRRVEEKAKKEPTTKVYPNPYYWAAFVISGNWEI